MLLKIKMISMHFLEDFVEKIGVNTLSERPEEAAGVYAKGACLIPWKWGNTFQCRQIVRLQGRF